MLFAADVDFQIRVAGILADNHAFVDFNVVRDKQNAPVFRRCQPKCRRDARFACQQAAVPLNRHLAGVWDVTAEQGVEDARAARLGQKLVAEAEQAARRYL